MPRIVLETGLIGLYLSSQTTLVPKNICCYPLVLVLHQSTAPIKIYGVGVNLVFTQPLKAFMILKLHIPHACPLYIGKSFGPLSAYRR